MPFSWPGAGDVSPLRSYGKIPPWLAFSSNFLGPDIPGAVQASTLADAGSSSAVAGVPAALPP